MTRARPNQNEQQPDWFSEDNLRWLAREAEAHAARLEKRNDEALERYLASSIAPDLARFCRTGVA
jgi:hypothetical protein